MNFNVLVSTLLVVLFCQVTSAQIEKKHFEALSTRNIGPAGMSGRITAIDVDLTNEALIYVGSASGGVWKSENAGTTWEPIFDEQPTLSIGSIKINQNNPDEVWVGTGEGNPRNSHNSGKGIFKSLDGGLTWKCMGLKETKIIHRIHIDPNNPNIVFAGAMGSAWGKSSHRGLYRSIDGGENWKKILYINDETGVADMVVDPSNPNKIFVAMWEFGRKPWTFNSGGKGSAVYRTIDGGENWINLSDEEKGFPNKTLGRTGLAISFSNPEIMYALVEEKALGLYKSSNGGHNWTLQSNKDVGNRPFYYAEIYVDPGNENRIFNLWSYVSMSIDGGKKFKTIMDYGNNIHPDHHAFWIHPENPNYMINGNDGGLNISHDGGKNWRFVTNLPVGQFYHISIDEDFPFNIYGGMQDNGSWTGPSYVLKRGGIRNSDWQELFFGDGFDVVPQPSDNRYGYAMYQGGNVVRYDQETGRTMPIQPTTVDSTVLRFNWNAPIAIDPFNPDGLFFGSQFVHYSDDLGYSWIKLSHDLTTNDQKKQQESLKSGGLTMDVTGAENYTTTLCIAPNKFDKNIIWVGTDDGNVQVTKDRGRTWTNVSDKLPGCPENAWIPQIVLSDINENEAFIVVNNYRQNDWTSYLYHTTNNGASFKRIVAADDIPSFVCSVKQDWKNENLLFLGTDVGLYISYDKGANWEKWENIPPVQIRDIQISSSHDALVLGTFGRSIWVIDDLDPFRKLASEGKSILNKELYVFDIPTAYKNSYRSYDGIRFVGQAEFNGMNKKSGARITIWKKPSDSSKEETKDKQDKMDMENKKDKKNKTKMYVRNSIGDTIRTQSLKLKEGMNQIIWKLDSKGPKRLTWKADGKDKNENGGMIISEGRYTIIIEDHGKLDSAIVEVKNDPRIQYNATSFDDKLSFIKQHNSSQEKAANLFEKLGKSEDKIKFVNQYLEMQTDSIKGKYIERGSQLQSEIDSLQNLFMLPKDTKGYVSSEGLLSPLLWSSRNYLGNAWGKPGSNSLQRLTNFENKLASIEKAINSFYDNKWIPYQNDINNLPKKLFDDLDLKN